MRNAMVRHVKTPYDAMTPEELDALTDDEIDAIEEQLMVEELKALVADPTNTARPTEELWRELGFLPP